MAAYKFSPTGASGTLSSVLVNSGSAFSLDSVGADSLTIDAGAYLHSTDTAVGTAGAVLANTGAWSVLVDSFGNIAGANGIILDVGNPEVSQITIDSSAEVRGNTFNGIIARSSVNISNSGSILGTTNGVVIEGGAASTINNTGRIKGLTNAVNDVSGSSNDTVTNLGTIEGNVNAGGGTNTVSNKGTIFGSVAGGAGNDTFSNTLTIQKQVDLGGGNNTLVNSGTIGDNGAGVSVLGGALGSDSVTNSGTLSAAMSLSDGTNTVLNSGTVGADASHQSYVGGSGSDTVTNKATMAGGVKMGAGVNEFLNNGTVGVVSAGPLAGASYIGGTDADTISNSGNLLGFVSAGDGANTFNNWGTIGENTSGQSYVGGSGVDTIVNAARLSTKAGAGGKLWGDLVTGDGDDVVSNTVSFSYRYKAVAPNKKTVYKLKMVIADGEVAGIIDLGAGADKLNGGGKVERVKDGDGADTYNLGGGNDFYIATGAHVNLDGNDIIDGGNGFDIYDASAAATSGVIINLDTIAQTEAGTGIGTTVAQANSALGIDVTGQPASSPSSPTDTILNFERAVGTQFDDVIFGSAGSNELAGNNGNDRLWGLGGNDQINGGAGNDAIIGGAGADTLAGGAGDDTFWYLAVSDSGPAAGGADLIADFLAGAGGDVINLSNIDANTLIAGNDAFSFIGTNVGWGGNAGELRATWTAMGQLIEGDINGDKVADFSISIIDVGHAIDLSGVNGIDFVL